MNYLRHHLDKLGRGFRRSMLIGDDGYFDLTRVIVKKYMDENPNRLRDYFRVPNAGTNAMIREEIDVMLQKVCGGSISTEPFIEDENEFLQIKIGSVALEGFGKGIRQRSVIPKKYIQT